MINTGPEERKAFKEFYTAFQEIEGKKPVEYEDVLRLLNLLHNYLQVPDRSLDTQTNLFTEYDRVWKKYWEQNNS